jgi:hypothetical protein
MKILAYLIIAGALVFSCAESGFAQAPATPPAAAAAPKATDADAAKKAKAKECSEKADAQGLHGKARKTFRAKCKAS